MGTRFRTSEPFAWKSGVGRRWSVDEGQRAADLVCMAKTFRPYEPDQLLLLPPAIGDWVPEGHLARFVSELVDGLDLGVIEDSYEEERGYPPYHPRMMVKVLLYAYATGIYSSLPEELRFRESRLKKIREAMASFLSM